MNDNQKPNVWTPRLLSILRIVAGYLFIHHGIQKIFGVLSDKAMPPFDITTQMGIGGVIELVGGALLMLGLLTRPAAFIMAGQMAVAYFQFHAPKGNAMFPILNGGEASVLYCFIFLLFAVAGGGSWSLDALIAGRKRSHADLKPSAPSNFSSAQAG